jgi:hypothetical protein
MPSTFSADGAWSAKVDENSPVAAGNSGIASVSGQVITVRDAVTGSAVWSSAPITGAPTLSFASDGGSEFLLATYGSGSNAAHVDAYLTTRSGEGIEPRSTARFSGKDDAIVTIKASTSGALISIGADRKVYRPNQQQTVAVSEHARALINDSILTVDPSGAFGVQSLSGTKVWSSSSVKPAGAKADSQGTFLAEDNGLIAAKWAGASGNELLVLLRAVGGTIAASAPLPAGGASSALLASKDGRWGVYANLVLNTSTGSVYELPADISPALVDRAVVYGAGDHGNAYDAIGKATVMSPKGAPKLVAPQGQGIFLSGTELTVGQMNSLGVKFAG